MNGWLVFALSPAMLLLAVLVVLNVRNARS